MNEGDWDKHIKLWTMFQAEYLTEKGHHILIELNFKIIDELLFRTKELVEKLEGMKNV